MVFSIIFVIDIWLVGLVVCILGVQSKFESQPNLSTAQSQLLVRLLRKIDYKSALHPKTSFDKLAVDSVNVSSEVANTASTGWLLRYGYIQNDEEQMKPPYERPVYVAGLVTDTCLMIDHCENKPRSMIVRCNEGISNFQPFSSPH